MGPLEAGIWTSPSGVVFALGSMAAPFLMRCFRARTIIACGFLIAAVGFAILTQLSATHTPWLMFLGMMVFCVGLAPIGAITTDLVMSEAPPERAGAASGISETSFEFGGALGIAVLGSILTAVYRDLMANEILAGLPEQSVAAAKDTLGGAVATAQELGGDGGAKLLDTAREAFVHAFEVTAAVSAAGAVAAALLAAMLLRKATR
jgi:DHA2 family multidrug resistance protein-like MFS transporter